MDQYFFFHAKTEKHSTPAVSTVDKSGIQKEAFSHPGTLISMPPWVIVSHQLNATTIRKKRFKRLATAARIRAQRVAGTAGGGGFRPRRISGPSQTTVERKVSTK